MRTGAEIVVDVLRSEGVRYVFGNPGSTETQFIDAVVGSPDLEYVLALHEGCVVAMADGYAKASRRPAVVNLHTGSGVGNAMGMLMNAQVSGTPLVVTAGTQHQRMLIEDPALRANTVGMGASVSKWAHEVRSVHELGIVLRRAFNDAQTPATGPVFVSLPWSIMEDTTDDPVPERSAVDRGSVAGSLEALAARLTDVHVGELALLLGHEVAYEGATGGAAALADALGAPVFSGNVPVGVFPPGHPLWTRYLPSSASGVRATLAGFRSVLVVGGQPFLLSQYSDGSPLPDGIELLHLSPDPSQLGRTYPAALGVTGGVRASLEALVPLVRERARKEAVDQAIERAAAARREAIAHLDESARERYGPAPLDPMAAIHAVLRAMPADSAVVDEAMVSGVHIQAFHHWRKPGRLYFAKHIIGWGMSAAIGVSMAFDNEVPVVAISGDGSATFGPQALWTAAHRRIPVIFTVLVNRQYWIIKHHFDEFKGVIHRSGATDPFDLGDPPIDYVQMAHSFGVDATSVSHADEIGDIVRAAREARRPHLIEIPVTVPE